jgi:hypothetical protein
MSIASVQFLFFSKGLEFGFRVFSVIQSSVGYNL